MGMARALFYSENPYTALENDEEEICEPHLPRTYASRLMAVKSDSPAASSSSQRKPSGQKEKVAAAAAKQPRVEQKTLDESLRTTAKAIDSGATLHVTGNKECLTNVRRCPPMPMKMADGTTVNAVYRGDLPLRLHAVAPEEKDITMTIQNVYFHERIDATLLSWGCMREHGWQLHSTPKETYVITPKGNRITTSTRGRLTLLNDSSPERVFAARQSVFVCKTAQDLIDLHGLTGHASCNKLLKMCRAHQTDGVGRIDDLPIAELEKAKKAIRGCTACAEGKQTRLSLGHAGLDHGKSAGEVLHMDTFQTTLRDPRTGYKYSEYCLLVTDPYTEMRWCVSDKSKQALQQAAVDLIETSATSSGRKPRLVVTDLGTEFENQVVKAYCRKNGIALQPSPARAKEMNGIAEKSVDTVKNHVRTMLAASKMPHHIGWRHAVQHHIYVWNRTHIARRTGKTPREASTGKTSSIMNFGVFGCDAFVHQDRTQRDTTFSPKALPGIYLGHDVIQNCSVVRMLGSGKTIRARDVVFREGSFTHIHALNIGDTSEVEPLHYPDAPLAQAEPVESKLDSPDDDESDADAVISDQRYTVRSITDKRTTPGGKIEYRVKWTGYSDESWEPAENIAEDAPEAVERYTQFEKSRTESRTTRSQARSQGRPSAQQILILPESDEDDDRVMTVAARQAAAQRL